MSGLVALISPRPDRAELGRRALAYLRHVPSWQLAELDEAGVWLGAVGRPEGHSVAHAVHGDSVAAVFCGTLLGAAAVARELGLKASGSLNAAALLLACYERWGVKGLLRVDGAFAYALVLRSDHGPHLLAGGDFLGIMRVMVTELGDDVMVATEAKAFLAHRSFEPALDEAVAAQRLGLGYVLDGQPLFKGVQANSSCSALDILPGHTRRIAIWDPRDDLGTRTGQAYLESLSESAVAMARDAFSDGDGVKSGEPKERRVVLPLTGGLDSRLLAAAAPADARPLAFTFGPGDDADSVLGRRVAQARGFRHQSLPFDEDYLANTAALTVWLSEGRLNPASNMSGFLMADFADQLAFVSGLGGEIGRRLRKTRFLCPDQALFHAGDAAFEQRVADRLRDTPLDMAATRRLLGPALREAFAGVSGELTRALAQTRGLHPVDRIDLFLVTQTCREIDSPSVGPPELYLDARAPCLTRRWIQAVLAGAPAERSDDLVRLRLISMLDPRVARVPWTMTHVPLPASALFLLGLRGATQAAHRLQPRRAHTGRRTVPLGGPALARLKKLIYSHGEQHDDWLRTTSSNCVAGLLRESSLAKEGMLEPTAVSGLLASQLAGANYASTIGELVNLELWHRLFVLRDVAALDSVREQIAAGAARPRSRTAV